MVPMCAVGVLRKFQARSANGTETIRIGSRYWEIIGKITDVGWGGTDATVTKYIKNLVLLLLPTQCNSSI